MRSGRRATATPNGCKAGRYAINSIRIGRPTRVLGIRPRALALMAAVALLTLSLGAGVASADNARYHRNAENTFTKWVTGLGPAPFFASMAGFVGGDVGDGAFTG